MDCPAFTVDFSGTQEELYTRMQEAASEQNFTLVKDENTLSVKVFGMTIVQATYSVHAQQITITITKNAPGYPCEKTQHIITKFITGGKASQ
jgi:hypothetical protein